MTQGHYQYAPGSPVPAPPGAWSSDAPGAPPFTHAVDDHGYRPGGGRAKAAIGLLAAVGVLDLVGMLIEMPLTQPFLDDARGYPVTDNEILAAAGGLVVFGLLHIAVVIPTIAYYPALRDFVWRDLLKQAVEAVSSARTARGKADEAQLALAEKTMATAEAELAALEARWSAEHARYLGDSPPGAVPSSDATVGSHDGRLTF